jgi:uncharacterized protein (TIGR04222 family)
MAQDAVLAQDTWGIPGPTFLGMYLVAAAAALIVALICRAILARGRVRPGWQPDPEQLAYFGGGPYRACLATLASLRAANAITTRPGGMLAVIGQVPPAPSALTWAVYQAAHRGTRVRDASTDPGVRPALDDIRETLIGQGWLLSPGRQAAIRAASLPVALVALVGGGCGGGGGGCGG